MNLHALTPPAEIALRTARLQSLLAAAGVDALLLADNANLYYALGRVVSGWAYLPVEGRPVYFVRRPLGLTGGDDDGGDVCYVHKPEMIPGELARRGLPRPAVVGLEVATLPHQAVERLRALLPDAAMADGSALMRAARAVKTDFELALLRRSGQLHAQAYAGIPALFRPGMRDVDLQIEVERELRRCGCLGLFRIAGCSMEIFMANLLVGDNADSPTPYDFAMGGAGMSPSLPVGADGTAITPGSTVMVDANGNFTGYMTDMTRVYAYGEPPARAVAAHDCSIAICRALEPMGRPGAKAADLYERAAAIAADRGLTDCFMGHAQQAGFVGHGVGIEINEAPVLAPRSRDTLRTGNVIAIEPKFVVPGVGAVGIENTYIVTPDGLERITNAPEQIVQLQ